MMGVWVQHMILGVTQGQTMLVGEKRHTSRRFQGAILTRAKMCRQLSRVASNFAVLRIVLLDVAQRQ